MSESTNQTPASAPAPGVESAPAATPPAAVEGVSTAAPAGGAEGGGAAEGGGGQGAGAPPPSTEQQPGTSPKLVQRLHQTTGKLREEQEKRRALEERLRAFEQGSAGEGTPPAQATPPNPAAYQADVEARARVLASERDFARQAESVAADGAKQFKDFNARIEQLSLCADHNDPVEGPAYVSMLRAAMATGQAPQLLHYLGGKPDEAERIIKMDVTRQAVEMARLAGTLVAPRTEISAVPKPATPVGGGGNPAPSKGDPTNPADADRMSIDDWMRERTAQLSKRRA